MKKSEMIELLKTDVGNWNKWILEKRKEGEYFIPHLSNADLRGAHLNNADLSNVDLRGAHLSEANLKEANLKEANLMYADLSNADLSYANLRNADLRNADLSNANLRGAHLRYANLSNVNLMYADLRNANLSNANLREANLREANLRNADLSNADLSNADLKEANLRKADLFNANLLETVLDPSRKPNQKNIEGFEKADLSGYVFAYRTKNRPHIDGPDYEIGKKYQVDMFSTCEETSCRHGLHICKSIEEAKEWGNIIIKVLIKIEDIHHAGTKYTCKEFDTIDVV